MDNNQNNYYNVTNDMEPAALITPNNIVYKPNNIQYTPNNILYTPNNVVEQNILKFPIKTRCSIQYNNYEIEIFSPFDDQPKCCLFWIFIMLVMILFLPIFIISFILQNTYCPRYMISRVYIYKKGNQIIIKRKGNNTCYCLYCASHSYFNINDIRQFDASIDSRGNYIFKIIDNNAFEDIILPVEGTPQEIQMILNFLNSLIKNNCV